MPTQDDSLPKPPVRDADSHKGTFGSVLIVAGSTGMSGAAILSGLGALRSGAGLVFVAVPESIQSIVAGYEPSYLTIGLPCDERGRIAGDAGMLVTQAAEKRSAIAVGPGLGQSDQLQTIVATWYAHCDRPMVYDADGLNLLAAVSVDWKKQGGPRILTPHPGEFARLTGCSTTEIQEHREEHAVEFAAKQGVVLVLKGHNTLITDGERLAVNQTGNSGLSTGGTGDVLTGFITGLLAQGMPPFDAARLGVHLHGLAGDIAAHELSQPGMIAADLPHFLTQAWKQVLGDGPREPVKQWQLL